MVFALDRAQGRHRRAVVAESATFKLTIIIMKNEKKNVFIRFWVKAVFARRGVSFEEKKITIEKQTTNERLMFITCENGYVSAHNRLRGSRDGEKNRRSVVSGAFDRGDSFYR